MSNPILNDRMLEGTEASDWSGARTMTVAGTVHRTGLLLMLVVGAALYTWNTMMQAISVGNPAAATPLVWGSMIGAFVLALITIFAPKASPFTSPVYAVLEGLFLGGISALYNARFPGIIMQAVTLTFGVFFFVLALYRFEVIRATNTFVKVVSGATGGIFVFYLIAFGASFFGVEMPLIHSSTPWGIGFSLVVVVLAALNLVLDFAFIEQGESAGLPKHMEWYGAFGLLVTIVWLYIELLRLLSKLKER